MTFLREVEMIPLKFRLIDYKKRTIHMTFEDDPKADEYDKYGKCDRLPSVNPWGLSTIGKLKAVQLRSFERTPKITLTLPDSLHGKPMQVPCINFRKFQFGKGR
jgi:hypothetical protein